MDYPETREEAHAAVMAALPPFCDNADLAREVFGTPALTRHPATNAVMRTGRIYLDSMRQWAAWAAKPDETK